MGPLISKEHLAKVTKQKTIEEENNFRSWVLIEFDQILEEHTCQSES